MSFNAFRENKIHVYFYFCINLAGEEGIGCLSLFVFLLFIIVFVLCLFLAVPRVGLCYVIVESLVILFES